MLAVIVATVGAVGISAAIHARFAVEDLVGQVLEQTSRRVEQRLGALLDGAADQNRIDRSALERGAVDRDECAAVTGYFAGVMQVRTQLSYLSYSRQLDGGYCDTTRAKGDDLKIRHILPGDEGVVRSEFVLESGTTRRVSQRQLEDGYDARVRPFYAAAVSARTGVWTPTYLFVDPGVSTGTLGVTRAAPVLDAAGAVAGVVTADFQLTALSRFLENLTVSAGGFAFVVERREDGDRVIAHPDQSLLATSAGQLATAEGFADHRVRGLVAAAAETQGGLVRFEHDRQGWLGVYRQLSGEGRPRWMIGIALPEDDVMHRVRDMNRTAIWLGLAGLVIAVLLAVWLAGRLARELRRLADRATAVADLQLEPASSEPSGVAEVNQLAGAFERMKTSLRGFQRYLPVTLVRLLHEQGQEPRLGGAPREVTIWFSDIAGFTSISEVATPLEMAVRLGDYLAGASNTIREHGGTVAQYVGDEVMALFNAPLDVDDHALKACRAALACQGLSCPTRFGLHTATVAVGHYGTEDRLYYGAIGDGVNLASRVEGLNKYYQTMVLLTRPTWERVKDHVVARPVDKVSVKGRTEGMMVYELLPDGDVTQRLADEYGKALQHYFDRSWSKAIAGFEACLKLASDDGPAKLLRARCLSFSVDPPPAGWSGVHVMETK